jgi:gliding motility-associated-like protein
MFRPLFFIILFAKCVNVEAQIPPWHWAKCAASSGSELAWDVTYDNFSGNSYQVGYFNGNLSSAFGASFTASNGGKDGFLAKIDRLGNVMWTLKIGSANDDEIRSVTTDLFGNVYVAGYFKNVCDFDPSPASYTLSPGGHECFLAKYDANGNFIWATRFGGSNEEDVWRICAGSDAIYLTGSYKNDLTLHSTNNSTVFTTLSSNDTEFFGAKYDLQGVAQWIIAGVSDKPDQGNDLVVDNINVYFIGDYGHDLNLYNALGTNVTTIQDQGGNKPNAMVIAMTQAGNYLWSTNVVSTEDDFGNGIGQDGSNVYITGSIKATASFKYPGAQFTRTIAGASDIYLAKISKANGDFVWVSSETGSGSGEEWGYGVKTDLNGNVIVTVDFKNTLNYSAFGGPTLSSSGMEDVATLGYNTSGNFLWAKQVTGSGKDVPHGLSVSPQGGIYVAGEYENAISLGTITLSPGNGTNIFEAKTGCEIPSNNSISASQNICTGNLPSTIIGSNAFGNNGYVWKMSANSNTWTNAVGTYTSQNYDPPVLLNTMFYKRDALGTCSNVSTSSVSVVYVDQYPTPAAAGSNKTVCATQSSLNANVPLIGTGQWSILSGSANISSASSASTNLSNIAPGANIFKWSISSGACPVSSSTVLVYGETPIAAVAGRDKQLCEVDTCYFNAANAMGFGAWSVLSGNANCSNITDPSAHVNSLAYGDNVFLWTVSKPNCPTLNDTIVVKRYQAPSDPVAGDDQVIERSSTGLNALIPSVGTGSWTLIEGSAQLQNVNDPRSSISKLSFGNNVARWTVTNGNCAAKYDDVSIYVKPLEIPNGFSPNADGFNDAFNITSLDYFENVRFTVFNRWGALVFKTDDYKNDWKGTNMQGQKLVDDTYYYVLEIPDTKSTTGFIVIKQDK